MSEPISPLDEGYMRLGRAAELMAQEPAHRAAGDVMDLLKRALFSGEFELPASHMLDLDAPNQPEDWLHMEIEVPRHELSPDLAALAPRPKRFYGVNRDTVMRVLETHDALPGTQSRWLPLLERFAPSYDPAGACAALTAIPFRDFPDHGRVELESIVVPVAKLTAWLSAQGLGVPSALVVEVPERISIVDEPHGPDEQTARSRGRPQKPSWPRVAEIVRQLHAAHPEWKLKVVAHAARQEALKEFPEADLPSEATIVRSMWDILRGGSG